MNPICSGCCVVTLLVGGFIAVRTAGAALPPIKGEDAMFVIRNDVTVKNPPRFGVNVHPPAMSHWSSEPWHNQWWLGPAVNPITARTRGVASGGDATTLEGETGWKLGFSDVFRDGFFDGGTATVYRFENGRMRPVRAGRIARFQAAQDGPNRLTFAETGPPVQAGDDYFLSVTHTQLVPEMSRPLAAAPWQMVTAFGLEQGAGRRLHEAGVRLAISPEAPPERGGGGCLALTIPAGLSETVRVGNWLHSAEQADFPRLRKGKVYIAKLWLRQSGMAQGRVEVRVGNLHTATLTVGAEWREYRFEIIGGPPVRGAERFDIGSAEAGTLFIDNVSLVERDGPPPYAFYPEVIETLRRFRPSTLRLWAAQENRGFGKALDDVLGPPEESNLTFSERGAVITDPVGLHRQLELCRQVGTDPWIIFSVMFTAEENRRLIEYLAGPPDSPYGRKRVAWGRAAPWTEVFKRIKLEMGNETWNPMFAPQQFSGRAAQYGAYADLMFREMQSSPWYRSGQFEFVVNGWVAQPNDRGYGAVALRHAPTADAVDIAYYTGGWDAVGMLKADSADKGWMNILTYSRRMLLPRAREFRRTAEAIAQDRGRPVSALVYEAGPGYTLPGPGKFDLAEQIQGKSLAQAINALDIFMSNLREGYGDQSFFIFKNGHYWASHNRTWGEHIAWKALGLRNTLLAGDLITAVPQRMITMDLPESRADILSQSNSANKRVRTFPAVPDLPLIDCYAFREGKRHSTMLVSRRLAGTTPVTLEFPSDPESAYTVHTLTGDRPDVHNIDAEAVAVQVVNQEGLRRTHTLNLPAHSVMVVISTAKELP